MTSAVSRLLMLGLRGSGKTTYLAALWHYLESAELQGGLSVPQLQPDRDYLNKLRNSWLALWAVGRTSSRAPSEISLCLQDRATERNIEISLPDISGELFRLQWANRKAPSAYIEHAKGCTGAFLFIHPKEIKRTHTIRPPVDSGERIGEEDLRRIAPAEHWSSEQSGTQVQLVDILQLLLRLRESDQPVKVAVIVSAWDLVRGRVSPAEWLDNRMPLLSQFLLANRNRFGSEVFAVSAQGGDLVTDRARLLGASVPSTRCHAMRGLSLDSVSIAAPLGFLLDTVAPTDGATDR
jgi:double-GTPase-like protein